MTRPYIAVYVAASLDGRIASGPNRTMWDEMAQPTPGGAEVWSAFESEIHRIYQPHADMLGSNSLVREGDTLAQLPAFTGDPRALYQDFLPDEVVKRPGHEGWLVVVDGRGRLRSGFKYSDDRPSWHMLHLVSYSVPAEYLAFLQKQQIPYLIAGEERVDLPGVMEKLHDKLGVKSLITSAGGNLSGALLRKGLVDEVNVLFKPELIGGFTTPSLFDSENLQSGDTITQLTLITIQVHSTGHVQVRYRLKSE